MWIVGLEWVALLVDYEDWTWSLGIVHTILGESYAAAWQCVLLTLWQVWLLQVDVVLVALELTAPEATEVNVYLIVGIIAMFAYNYLVSRVDSITNWLEAQTLSFMDMIKE